MKRTHRTQKNRQQKKLFLGLCLIAALTASTRSFADEFEKGAEDNFKVSRFSDDQIQIEIENKIRIACKGDRCELASVTSHGEAFTVSISTGYGDPNGSNTNNGGVVVVDSNGGRNNDFQSQPYVGVTLRYIKGSCTQSVNVPKSLYVAMNTYLYHLINEDGSIERQFTPAQQTMILFYTTILKQASGCNSPN